MSRVGVVFLEELERKHADDQRVRRCGAPERYFRLLEQRFPLAGSKIDWTRVPRSIVVEADPQDADSQLRHATSLLLDVTAAEGIADERVVVVIGDSAMEDAVSLPLAVLRAAMPAFLALPQHLYVLPEDGSWCLSFTMEGDVAFGHATGP
jgi:hypothetical protein